MSVRLNMPDLSVLGLWGDRDKPLENRWKTRMLGYFTVFNIMSINRSIRLTITSLMVARHMNSRLWPPTQFRVINSDSSTTAPARDPQKLNWRLGSVPTDPLPAIYRMCLPCVDLLKRCSSAVSLLTAGVLSFVDHGYGIGRIPTVLVYHNQLRLCRIS